MSLLDQMSLSRKFLVLGAIALLMAAIPTALHVRKSVEEIQDAKREARAMPPLIALQKVIQFTQQHRGLSAGLLAGNTAMKERRLPIKDKVNTAIQDVDAALDQANASAAVKDLWAQRKQSWTTLEQGVASAQLSSPDSTKQHTQLIATFMAFNAEVMNEFRLLADPDLAVHDLIVSSFVSAPWLTEKLGILRATGTGILAKGELSAQTKGALISLKDRNIELQAELAVNLRHAAERKPAFAAVLAEPAKVLLAQVDATLAMADQKLINAADMTFPSTQYFDEFTRTIDAVYTFNALALNTLKTTLEDRVQAYTFSVIWILGMQLVGTVLAIWLALVFIHSITRPMSHALKLATAVSNGDLTQRVEGHGSNEIGQLLAALSSMQAHLNGLVSEVRSKAQGVATASDQIAQGNNDLSARTEQAAAALEETAASMDQLHAHVQTNADHAKDANTLSHHARDVAIQGGEVVTEVVNTMRDINTASSKIADIIGVIDGIAFQTNILALNAAVEAARAGEAGRGFAVVASEVRSLAGRSAEAAKEIKGLISDSVSRVQAGTTLVDQAGQTMNDVVSSIKRVTDLMADISAASAAQSLSVSEVGQAVTQMDQATQQNAALVEESAAAAASMNQQAQQLLASVQAFKTA